MFSSIEDVRSKRASLEKATSYVITASVGFPQRDPHVAHLNPGISGGEKSGPLHAVVGRQPISPSPNAGDQALRHRHILLVVLPEFLKHHPLLGSDAEAYEESHRDAGGQARHVVGENERLAHRV